MGEAKRKEAWLRAAILQECDLWDRPGTPWEAAAVEEVLRLPFVEAVRPPERELRANGMRPRECHANAYAYAKLDPNGISKHVLGWWRQGDIFVLHSVVEYEGRYICLTPQERDISNVIPFVPDKKIEAREEGDILNFYRDGEAIVAGLRINPEAHRAAMVLMRERLNAGMKPWPAMRLADDEACERLGIPRARNDREGRL